MDVFRRLKNQTALENVDNQSFQGAVRKRLNCANCVLRLLTCQEVTKKMLPQNSDMDLSRQEHITNEISLTRYEIILTDFEIFCLTAKCEIKFVPPYAAEIFHTRSVLHITK